MRKTKSKNASTGMMLSELIAKGRKVRRQFCYQMIRVQEKKGKARTRIAGLTKRTITTSHLIMSPINRVRVNASREKAGRLNVLLI